MSSCRPRFSPAIQNGLCAKRISEAIPFPGVLRLEPLQPPTNQPLILMEALAQASEVSTKPVPATAGISKRSQRLQCRTLEDLPPSSAWGQSPVGTSLHVKMMRKFLDNVKPVSVPEAGASVRSRFTDQHVSPCGRSLAVTARGLLPPEVLAVGLFATPVSNRSRPIESFACLDELRDRTPSRVPCELRASAQQCRTQVTAHGERDC